MRPSFRLTALQYKLSARIRRIIYDQCVSLDTIVQDNFYLCSPKLPANPFYLILAEHSIGAHKKNYPPYTHDELPVRRELQGGFHVRFSVSG
jgi:hypothetical protein